MGAALSTSGKEANEGSGSGYMSGWTTGVRNNSEFLSFDVAYAEKIKSPIFIATKEHEIYFTVSTKIGF
jgi:hemolysin activation/secretion protein